MKVQWLPVIILPAFIYCRQPAAEIQYSNSAVISKLSEIPLPPGYTRVEGPEKSFAAWLRDVKIKEDKHVYLYNGQLKGNQSAQFAVLDIPVGKKDLQQ